MMPSYYLAAFTGNWIVWAIVLLGLGSYSVMLNLILAPRDARWAASVAAWLRVLPVLLSALPLLGLLGTIVGLMATFDEMAARGGLNAQELLTSGIAAALITTQLGLVMVIPGLLMATYLRGQHAKAVFSNGRRAEAEASR